MQVIDDRESRLRSALEKIEEKDGRILRESIIRLVTVSLALVYFTNLGQILPMSAHGWKYLCIDWGLKYDCFLP